MLILINDIHAKKKEKKKSKQSNILVKYNYFEVKTTI